MPPALLGEFSSTQCRHAPPRLHERAVGPRSAGGVGGDPAREVTGRRMTSRRGLAAARRLCGPALELDPTSTPTGGRALVAGEGPCLRLRHYDEHGFAGVIAVTPHGGAHRRDVVAAFAGAARDGVAAASLERLATCGHPRPGWGWPSRSVPALRRPGEPPAAGARARARSIRPITRRGCRRRGRSTTTGSGGGSSGRPSRSAPTQLIVVAARPSGRPPACGPPPRRGAAPARTARASRDGARAGPVTDTVGLAFTGRGPGAPLDLDSGTGSGSRSCQTDQIAPRRARVGRGQGDLGDVLVRTEYQRTPGDTTGHGVDGEAGLA